MTQETYRRIKGKERSENPQMALFSSKNRVFAGKAERKEKARQKEMVRVRKEYGL